MNTEFVSINGTYYPDRESAPWQIRGSLVAVPPRVSQTFPAPAPALDSIYSPEEKAKLIMELQAECEAECAAVWSALGMKSFRQE